MGTIPASQIVQVNPGVLAAGGQGLDIIAVILTTSTRVPIDAVQAFATADDVSNYFGSSSSEYALALIYFNGYDNSAIKPSKLYFAQYPEADVAPYLRGGNVSGLTLAELQAIPTGTLTITMDGNSAVAASVNLSAATSFTDAASIIETAFNAVSASCDGGTISGTVLTVAGTVTGTFAVGQTISGVGVTAGSYIASLGTGTGGVGTYNLNVSSTVAVGETIDASWTPAVTYDSTAGAFVLTGLVAGAGETIGYATDNALAQDLKLTLATGAVTSQGAGAATPGTFMDGVKAVTTDWATFMTAFDPDSSGNTNKLAFASWANSQSNRFAYVCWDTDTSPATTDPATSSLGYLIAQNSYAGTYLIGGDTQSDSAAASASYAAFICGAAASINFTGYNARITFAFKSQSGLLPTCTNATAALNLISNGYNFYGAYATANDEFVWNYPGSVSGDFLWMDSFINQIWMNNEIQLAIMVLYQNTPSIPYNKQGYALIEAACLDPIRNAVNFGAIRKGITLSAAQIAEINAAAGKEIDKAIVAQGWYLQVLDATPAVRQARQSPPITLWYTDGQSVQQISLASIDVL